MCRPILSLLLSSVFILLLTFCCSPATRSDTVLENNLIYLKLTPESGLAVSYKQGQGKVPLTNGTEPAFLIVDTLGRRIPFILKNAESFDCGPGDRLGPGRGIKLTLACEEKPSLSGVELQARLSLHDSWPGVVIGRVDILGLTKEVLAKIRNTRFYHMSARADLANSFIPEKKLAPYDFHLFQGAVYKWGEWYTRIKLTPDYDAPNWTIKHGEKQTDGGGMPLVYLWTEAAGLALAHIDTVHRVAALPVKVRGGQVVEIALERPAEFLRPGSPGKVTGLPVMIGAFGGDYFSALRSYGNLLQRNGFRFAEPPPASYEPIWCSWGFGRAVVPEDILRTLPEVKRLEIPWVVMDDGFQSSIGYWPLDKAKFPRGDTDMRALVDSIHAAGMKAKLWWVPMNMSPDDPLYAEHPEWVVLDKQGNPKREPYWNVFQLCPAYKPVVEQQRALVRRFMKDWDYDGFKMDGACLGMVSPCYNPAHNHARPEQSCEAVASFFAAIKQEAESIKPGCVLEVCECGIPHNPYKMAHYNQQVSSDPTSSDQVRARLKMYRALLGDKAALYGDHVELATGAHRDREKRPESGTDFASTLALGGVIGSKFTVLVDDASRRNAEKYEGIRPLWEHWFRLYKKLRLYEGRYLNLYDIANDIPETHVVARGDTLYYGIFAESFTGNAPLRGLEPGQKYTLTDYADSDRALGEITGAENAGFDCAFEKHLLIRATPLP